MKFFDDYNTKVSASMVEFIEVHFESRYRTFTDKNIHFEYVTCTVVFLACQPTDISSAVSCASDTELTTWRRQVALIMTLRVGRGELELGRRIIPRA